jgi:Lsr2
LVMGKSRIVGLVDDIDGTTATEVVEFGLDGVRYRIALSSVNAEALRHAITQWALRGRRRNGRPRHLVRADPWRSHVNCRERDAIREWCDSNGYPVGSRGPLPFHVVDAFRAAMPEVRAPFTE